ncbi:MAG: O-antigen ligase family protein [Verrucomicrobiae bacterium]|nr:O-antigen ligase family protein [Verrucomicrobiae bacterium]
MHTTRANVDRWLEHAMLVVLGVMLAFGPVAMGAVRLQEFLLVQALAIALLGLWLLRLWVSPEPRLFWPPVCWPVAAFILYAVVRYLSADIEYVARAELIRLLVYAAVFFVVINNLQPQASASAISFALVFVGMGIAAYAIYQFITGSDYVWQFVKPYKHRGSGTYINPNHLAGLLEMLLPVALGYVIAGRQKPVTKVLLGYAALVILFGLAVTVSRGSWVAAGLSLLLFFGILAWRSNYRLPAIALFTLLVVACVYFAPRSFFLEQRVRRTVAQVRYLEADTRYELWDATVRMWKDHFWFGVGPGHFDYCFRKYRPESIQARPDRAHNDYLNALADWGTAGGAILAAMLGLFWAGVLKAWRRVRELTNGELGRRSSNRFAFVLGASLGLVALLLHSWVDFNLHVPANALVAVGLGALITAHIRYATDRHWLALKLPGKLVATVILACCILYLGWQQCRRTAEVVCLNRADRARDYSRAQVAALERAFAVEPNNFETAYRIGEAYRLESWLGNDNYADLARAAMSWFERVMRLNPHDPYGPMRYGMCLDWLGDHAQAEPYYRRAEELDPHGYFTLAHVGWHYVQAGNYAAARPWFERSRRLQPRDNPIAVTYLELVKRRLLEQAIANASGGTEPAATAAR